ncbi:hypothetical protein NUACC21_65200 [Scytonema sp. NUACC21]
MELEHLYTKKQAAQLRQQLMDGFVIPIVQMNFQKYPTLRSAAMMVAQYWDDEASDAVHHCLIYSVLDTPDLEAAAKADVNYSQDKVNLKGLGRLDNRAYSVQRNGQEMYWPDNHDAIPAFAAYCKEGCHQSMDTFEAYTPYAILRRQDNAIDIEVVGKMLRPWLDGIKPDWER